jgi:phosphate/sulfate permease/protein-tyrosine-phosphatase
MFIAILCGFAAIGLLALGNGANDLSRATATLVAGGISSYRNVVCWVVTWTLAGSLLSVVVAFGVAKRFAARLATMNHHGPEIVPAAVLAACLWVGLSTWRSLPVSTTHALLGSILAMNWRMDGIAPWQDPALWRGFVLPLVTSPVISLAVVVGVAVVVRKLKTRTKADAEKSRRSLGSEGGALDRAHWISSGLVALSRGINDSAKIWAPALVLAEIGKEQTALLGGAVFVVALAMAVGGWVGGQRVTNTLAYRITDVAREDGLVANCTTAAVIVTASFLGFPVASSHVAGGAMIGVGLSKPVRFVNWRVATEMMTGWLLTLPMAAGLALVCWAAAREIVRAALPERVAVYIAIILAMLVIWMLKGLKRPHFFGAKPFFRSSDALLLTKSLICILRRLQWPQFFSSGRFARFDGHRAARRMFIFVCSGNVSRSPMAQAICSSQLAELLGISVRSLERRGVRILSAGLSAHPGDPMTVEARQALAEIGIPPSRHRARLLKPDLVSQAEAIFCMTRAQREAAISAFPADARKIHCLDPDHDLQDPYGRSATAFVQLAGVLQTSIRQRVREYLIA